MLHGPRRLPAKDPRLPRGTGRDRGRPLRTSRRTRGPGAGPRKGRRPLPAGLPGGREGRGSGRTGRATCLPGRTATGLHGPHRLPPAGILAPDPQQEGGPRRPETAHPRRCRAAGRRRATRIGAAQDRHGTRPAGHLAIRPGTGPTGHLRQLLRHGRPQPAGHPHPGPHPRRPGLRRTPAPTLRTTHRGPTGRVVGPAVPTQAAPKRTRAHPPRGRPAPLSRPTAHVVPADHRTGQPGLRHRPALPHPRSPGPGPAATGLVTGPGPPRNPAQQHAPGGRRTGRPSGPLPPGRLCHSHRTLRGSTDRRAQSEGPGRRRLRPGQ